MFIAGAGQVQLAAGQRLCQPLQRSDPAAGHADTVQIELAQLGRGGQLRHPELRLGARHQPPEYGDGPLDRYLLSDNGAQHHLVLVPAGGQPNPRPACLQACQQRILPEPRTDALHVGIEIPHPAHPIQQIRQRGGRQIMDAELQAVPLALADAHPCEPIADPVQAFIHLAIYPFQPRNGAQPVERQHGRHVIRGAVGQLQREHRPLLGLWRSLRQGGGVAGWLALTTQRPRRQPVCLLPGVVEAANAGKARRKRDVGDGQPGFGQQPLGEQQPARLLHLFWRSAEVLLELAAQRAFTDAGLFSQRGERAFRQLAAINPGQQAYQCRRQIAGRGGRELRPAAQAGAQAVLLRCGGALEVAHVVLVRWPRRTDRAAVDAGGEHAGKEAAVEARIAGQAGGMALLGAERQA